jgi:hypothetical protein
MSKIFLQFHHVFNVAKLEKKLEKSERKANDA